MTDERQQQKRIIVIDDDPVMRLSCLKILKKEGFFVEAFEDGEMGLARIREQKPDLLVVDLKMPKMGGLEVISRVKQIDPDICIVVITGYATIGTAVEAMKTGAYDFLPKPFTPDELRLIVNRGFERIELSRQSKRLKAEKEKIERRFISFVSHQLQSPLVAVQQYLDVLQHLGDLPKTAGQRKDWIDRSIARIKEMRAIVNDWLTISKIESGQFVANRELLPILRIIEDVIDSYSLQAKEQEIELASDMPEQLDSIKCHEECLRMLVSNLISNAIKYTPSGGKVSVKAREDADGIYISVTDTGIGIPSDKLEVIFEEFYRIKCESTRHIAGTGLGLPICRKIVTELGGTIEVTSAEKRGSTFTIRLPKEASTN
ncbi:response regulator [candidate division KSB1 bacterium]|nr:response regulator [candidate division KSB1 bacterium]